MTATAENKESDVILTKDEMNLVEIPFGPITAGNTHYFEVRHEVYDRILKRRVTRATLITGSQLFGLPRPIDDQVLVGMQALTYEAGYSSRKVHFSRYHLCRLLGWNPDGRSYRRLEQSFDRIAGTTLKFKDAWYDKGEREWKSKTFHLIEEVDLCSRDRLDRTRLASGRTSQKLCSFTWNDILFKSFEDGFIKSLSLKIYRTIAKGRRREVPLRLFRILDKRFHRSSQVQFELRTLSVGILGLSPNYGPSQMLRIIARAANWLTECGYLRGFQTIKQASLGSPSRASSRPQHVVFYKKMSNRRRTTASAPNKKTFVSAERARPAEPDSLQLWLAEQSEDWLLSWENQALLEKFGSLLEQGIIHDERKNHQSILQGSRIRHEYLRRYAQQATVPLNV